MVGAVNAPSNGATFLAFEDLAKKTNSTTNPPSGPIGGTLKINKGSQGTTVTTGTTATTKPTGSPDCITTTYKTTYTSSGVVCTTDVTTTITKGGSKPSSTVPVVNGAGKVGAGVMAAVAAVAML